MAESNTNTTGNNPRGNSVRRNFISECRDNRIIVQAKLSPRMRRIYRRHFDGFSRSAYLIRYYSRIVRENGVEAQLVNEIITMINGVKENLEKKISVADQLLGNNKVTIKEPQFEEANVTIIDPLANQFLKTFMIAQDLENKLGALWLACVLDEDNHKAALNDIDTELRGLVGKSRTLSLGLRDRVRVQGVSIEQSAEIDMDISTAALDELDDEGEATESNKKPATSKRASKSGAVSNDPEEDAESAKHEEVVD